jgi:lysozyme family protein
MGLGQAAKLLQHAVNVCGWPGLPIAEDGAVGPKTINAVNNINGTDLLTSLKVEAVKFYRNLAASQPVLAGNLASWLNRVNS